MRTLGVAILGVFAGLIVGYGLIDQLLSRLLIAGGADIGVGWGLMIGFGPIVLAVVGAVVAIVIDQRLRSRGARA